MVRKFSKAGIGLRLLTVALAGWISCGPTIAAADDKSPAERQQDRADKIRERAKNSARANLGYEDVFPSLGRDYSDSYALSQQVARLAALIRRLADAAATMSSGGVLLGAPPYGPGGLLGSRQIAEGDDVAAIYGPKGPTAESVKLLLDYYILVADNPRLTAGPVRDAGEAVIARIVTKDGNAVVEEYAVNKKTGVWVPVR